MFSEMAVGFEKNAWSVFGRKEGSRYLQHHAY